MNNTVQANYIGTNVTGETDLGNTVSGVAIGGTVSDHLIGGAEVDKRNVISGNDGYGIFIGGGGINPTNIAIQGNYIGTNSVGNFAVGNALGGVRISEARQHSFWRHGSGCWESCLW